jgi:hypothetical protein
VWLLDHEEDSSFIFGIFADIPLQRLMMNLCIPMSIVESIEKSSPHFAKCPGHQTLLVNFTFHKSEATHH